MFEISCTHCSQKTQEVITDLTTKEFMCNRCNLIMREFRSLNYKVYSEYFIVNDNLMIFRFWMYFKSKHEKEKQPKIETIILANKCEYACDSDFEWTKENAHKIAYKKYKTLILE